MTAPVLLEPAENAALFVEDVRVRWKPVAGRIAYRCTLEDLDTGEKLYADRDIDREELPLSPEQLVGGHRYRVAIQAVSDMPDATPGSATTRRELQVQPVSFAGFVLTLDGVDVAGPSPKLVFSTNLRCRALVELVACSGPPSDPHVYESVPAATYHELDLVGLRPATEYEVVITSRIGGLAEGPWSITHFWTPPVRTTRRPPTAASKRL